MEKSRQGLKNPGGSGDFCLATRVGLNQIRGSDVEPITITHIEELVNLSLTYEVLPGLNMGKIPILHQVEPSIFPGVYLNTLSTRALELREEEQKKTCHIKVKRRKCQEK